VTGIVTQVPQPRTRHRHGAQGPRVGLSGSRRVRPFGLAGGESGELGENAVRRADGRIEKLQGCDATTIEAGGTIIIKTPTGGGYGEPAK
jgi:N-methylhydantoinase B/oxoprolinase/acetone carboxylase alpha subunit